MKYYIIAGEASGDLHAANLMHALKQADADARFRVWGGDRMMAAGGVPVKHIRELAFMGFAEVVMNLGAILRNFRLCRKDLLNNKPDVLILVDYPGFNLKMAAFAKKHGIPVVYYISPQLWAWKQGRVRKVRRYVDRMLVILPFERDFYDGFGVDVAFVGHPLLDVPEIATPVSAHTDFFRRNDLPDRPLVAVLPGSREQEVSRLLSDMVAVADRFPEYQFVIAGLSLLPENTYDAPGLPGNVSLVIDQTYDLLSHSRAALVASGTATLEAALFGVPLVVCYRASTVSYHIARRLVKVRYISLVNLIMNEPLVRELIQHDFSRVKVADELERLLHDAAYREKILSGYEALRSMLGGSGASQRAASEILALLKGPV